MVKMLFWAWSILERYLACVIWCHILERFLAFPFIVLCFIF